jgi:putative membrane protein
MLPITAKGYPSVVQRFALRVLATALAVLLASGAIAGIGIPGIAITTEPRFVGAIVFALILGVLNAFLRPILLLLTLPLNILTLGLFTLVVNAIVFWLASLLGGGVQVDNFPAAFLGALLVSVVSFVASRVLK